VGCLKVSAIVLIFVRLLEEKVEEIWEKGSKKERFPREEEPE